MGSCYTVTGVPDATHQRVLDTAAVRVTYADNALHVMMDRVCTYIQQAIDGSMLEHKPEIAARKPKTKWKRKRRGSCSCIARMFNVHRIDDLEWRACASYR